MIRINNGLENKHILDVCCGLRAMWFNKNHPNAIYYDKRNKEKGFDDFRPNYSIVPDIQGNWANLPFHDNTFKLVVMDPPHILHKEDSKMRMVKYYGNLDRENWREHIKAGFDECWRVLDNYGVLIFKWSEADVPKKEVLEVIGKEPLFGHPNGSRVPCHWLTFMKIPAHNQEA
jgi:SAM-dependent methyltransferase